MPSFTVTEEQLLATQSRLTEVELDRRRVGGRSAGWLDRVRSKGERDGCKSCSWRLLSCYRLVSARPEAGSGDTQVGVAEGLNWRRSVQRCSDISWQMEGLLRAAAVERGGGGGLVGLLGGRIGSFGQCSACASGRQNCVPHQRRASRTPVDSQVAVRIEPDRPQPECLHGHRRFAHHPRSHAAPSWLASAGSRCAGTWLLPPKLQSWPDRPLSAAPGRHE